FVLDREFTGLKAEVGTGITERGDGQRWNLSLAGGKQIGDRMHVIGSVQAMHINQINREAHELDDWYDRWGWVTNPQWVSTTATPNIPQRLTVPKVCSNEHSPAGVIWARNGSASTSPLIPFSMNGLTFTHDGTDVRSIVSGDYNVPPNRPGAIKSMSGGSECELATKAFGTGVAGNEVVNR